MHIYSKQEKLTTSNLQPLRMSFAHFSPCGKMVVTAAGYSTQVWDTAGTAVGRMLGRITVGMIKLRFSNYGSATTAQQLRFSNHASATTDQQLRFCNHDSATTAQQPRLSNQTRFSLQQLRFSNYASATKTNSGFSNHASATTLQQPKSTLASATKPQQPKLTPPLASTYKVTSYTSYQNPTPLASTCTVSSYTSYQNPTPSGKYMHSLILHVISKSHPLWQVHAQSHLTLHDQNPTPSGKHMQGHILHVISKYHPLWQVHAKSHLTRHVKIPPPLASTCTVSSYTSYQNPTPSGKYMHSLILHVISKSHPLWQVQGQPHLTLHDQNPTPSGKYMQGHILHVISKYHPLWQVHAQSHLTRHIKIPPPLASTCAFSSYTSYQNPTPSGKYMQSHILHVISKSHPLWQVHAQSHLTRLRILVYET